VTGGKSDFIDFSWVTSVGKDISKTMDEGLSAHHFQAAISGHVMSSTYTASMYYFLHQIVAVIGSLWGSV
jgi:hypothetical protein